MRTTFFMLLMLAASTIVAGKNIVICGKIVSAGNVQYQLFAPVNGYFSSLTFPALPESSYQLADDSFYLKTELAQPSFFDLFVNVDGDFFGRSSLLILPGDSLHINVFTDRDKDWIRYDGSNAAGHAMFNSMMAEPIKMYLPVQQLVRQLPALDNINKKVLGVADSLSAPYYSLQQSGRIGEKYTQLLHKYFKMSLLGEVLQKVNHQNSFSQQLPKSLRFRIMKEVLELQPVDDVEIPSLLHSTRYLINAHRAVSTMREGRNFSTDFDMEGRTIALGDSTVVIDKLLSHLSYIPESPAREALWAIYLGDIMRLSKGYFDAHVLQQYDLLFPNSPYASLLRAAYVMHRPPSYATMQSPFPVKMLSSFESLNAIAQKEFSGKWVLVDLWATWCGPCISAFAHNPSIDSFLVQQWVERLYISLDEPSHEEKWKGAIEKYKLGGHHVIAGPSLVRDLKQQFGIAIEEGIAIPRYLLLNPQGRIILDDAPHPGSPALRSQILKSMGR